MSRVAHLSCVLCLVLTAASANAQTEPPMAPGSSYGNDTQFTVSLDDASFTITTTDPIQAAIQALASDALELAVDASTEVASTQITVTGLPAGASLYRSEDDLRNVLEVVVDETGSLTWVQDLTAPHSILIKPDQSTWYLGDSGWTPQGTHVPGTWDSVTKTAVLTEDVFETVQIMGNGITLDGGGFQIVTGATYGVYIVGSQNVTIRNADVTGGQYGVYAFGGTGHSVETSAVTSPRYGVYGNGAHAMQVTSSTVTGGLFDAIRFIGSNNVLVQDNTLSANGDGVFSINCGSGQILGNDITGGLGIVHSLCSGVVTINDNRVNVNGLPISIIDLAKYIVTENRFRSHTTSAIQLRSNNQHEIYNNDFVSDVGAAPTVICGSNTAILHLPAPVGGNYWTGWTGPDADLDGFVDVPYSIGCGQADGLPYALESGWAVIDITGTVTSDCGGAESGITIEVAGSDGGMYSTSTDANGAYAFIALPGSVDYDVSVVLPDGFVADTPTTGTLSLYEVTDDVVVDFAIGCVFDVSGTVSNDCGASVAGVTIGLDAGGEYTTTTTDADGHYAFDDIRYETDIEITCVLPLGFHAISPTDAHIALTVTSDQVADFALGCLAPTGVARSMGYWKHQANVYVLGRGNAQESETDMRTTYPEALYSHFYDNELSAIAVEGVTFMVDGGDVPLDLETIRSTLTARNSHDMLDRAKQHYLALLLNVASGKILSFDAASEDVPPFTVSQALQDVADLINDPGSTDADYATAKDIAEALNEATLVAAGVIRDMWDDIAYRTEAPGAAVFSLAQNRPNPFNPTTTIGFTLPTAGAFRLAIFDGSGREVRDFQSWADGGPHTVVWDGLGNDGHPVASGVYFYTLRAGASAETRKMILTK